MTEIGVKEYVTSGSNTDIMPLFPAYYKGLKKIIRERPARQNLLRLFLNFHLFFDNDIHSDKT